MRKKALLLALVVLQAFFLSGCWNYRGLNELAIVSGITVDIEKDTNEFTLGYEVIDLAEDVKSSGLKAILIESKGKTIFDAARNAKRRLEKKLYFGNTLLVVVSEEIAKSGHLMHIIDWFLRDAELRESAHMVVAQTPTAADLLKIEGVNNAIVAFEMENIVSDDNTVTSSLTAPMLYQAYNLMHSKGKDLTLPAFHVVINDEEPAAEANGIALFKGEAMVGFLSPEETKYVLFANGQVQGGILTLSTTGDLEHDVGLEISKSSAERSFSIENGQLNMNVNIEVVAYLAEAGMGIDALNEEEVTSLEAMAGAAIKERTEAVIEKMQTEYHSDVFGFGSMIHQKNPTLWKQVSDNWNDGYFPGIKVSVHAKASIVNTAYLKKSTNEGE